MITLRLRAAAAISLLALATPSIGHAREPWLLQMPNDQDYAQVAVKSADLDLSTQNGQDALHRRIQIAARHVCDIGWYPRTAISACIKGAITRAKPAILAKIERSRQQRLAAGVLAQRRAF